MINAKPGLSEQKGDGLSDISWLTESLRDQNQLEAMSLEQPLK